MKVSFGADDARTPERTDRLSGAQLASDGQVHSDLIQVQICRLERTGVSDHDEPATFAGRAAVDARHRPARRRVNDAAARVTDIDAAVTGSAFRRTRAPACRTSDAAGRTARSTLAP